jgi:hypothetical protein
MSFGRAAPEKTRIRRSPYAARSEVYRGMSATRVPTNHRPTMTSCPQGRGAGISISTTGCPQSPCLQDSDCTSGMNGRCLNGPSALTCIGAQVCMLPAAMACTPPRTSAVGRGRTARFKSSCRPRRAPSSHPHALAHAIRGPGYFWSSTSIGGMALPSRYSRLAPPPVDT